ncbi:acyl carrier protein [Lentzea nigeriaca]|uniref:acyl carrier protein n=1 Tax=Lentzea nigeriaca TaxID=1128665 RepID=UPI00195844B4|nr:acyl carrier protein [Lentzea nigeriaca]MBM7856349.1 acyl carrier protein [Lentzea nigeriaca]
MTVFQDRGLVKEIEDILVRSAGLSPDLIGDGTQDATLEELGLDSLACMELQAVVRDRYGVRIPEESLDMSIPQIVEHIGAEIAEAN